MWYSVVFIERVDAAGFFIINLRIGTYRPQDIAATGQDETMYIMAPARPGCIR